MPSEKTYLIQSLLTDEINAILPNSKCRWSKADKARLYEFLKDLSSRIATLEATLIRNGIV